MDPGLDAAPLEDTEVRQLAGAGAPSFSCHAEVACDREDESQCMDVDSESTYSCLNTSSDDKSGDGDGDGEHELTFQNDLSVYHGRLSKDAEDDFGSPATFENDSSNHESFDHGTSIYYSSRLGIDGDDKRVSATEDSVEVNKDEAREYIVPKLGVEFESEDHAYKCYNKYALMEGFSIRKDFVNRSKITGLVVSRRYTCHRQGYGSAKRDVNGNKPRKETRTGCLAHMTITRQTNGKYRVIHLETRHNHEFVTPYTAHLLPSQKRISFVEAVEAELATSPVPDGVPKLGMAFDSEVHAYDFYNAYARKLGFSVRKDYVNRSKRDGAVASRRYTCCREGYRQKDKRGLKVSRPRKETRVGCMAQLVISRQADGRYRATHFEEHHNHELVLASKVRTLRSQKRSISQVAESNVSGGSNGQPKTLTELLLAGVEHQDDVCYDPVDHEMSLTSRRGRNINQEETESILQYFINKKMKDSSFVYAVQLDVEGKMSNFFWADGKMLADYGDFGDVVCFDTTCCQSKDWCPLVLFLGTNNHKQMAAFGAALLYDDTARSFEWLFQTFIKTMSGRKPKTVLTAKGAVISDAIVTVMPGTDHRLCTWQIYQNTVKRLSQEVAISASLSRDLFDCFFNTYEEDFLNTWKVMLDTYSLWENEWLHSLTEEREKWALSYSCNTFLADIETTLVSEDSITSLQKYLKPDSHALQFAKHFARLVNDWSYKELEANYDMGQHLPRMMGDVIMLKQVREVYTPIIFEMFHHEYETCLNIVINQCMEEIPSSVEYKVSLYGQVRQYTVLYSSEDDSVACNCMKFQSVGILCSHALKVLDYRNIKIVPSRYILKRWTRDART